VTVSVSEPSLRGATPSRTVTKQSRPTTIRRESTGAGAGEGEGEGKRERERERARSSPRRTPCSLSRGGQAPGSSVVHSNVVSVRVPVSVGPRSVRRTGPRPSTFMASPPRGAKSRVGREAPHFSFGKASPLTSSLAPAVRDAPKVNSGLPRSKGSRRCSPRPYLPSTDSTRTASPSTSAASWPKARLRDRPMASALAHRTLRSTRPRLDLRPVEHRRRRRPFHAS